jgi:hypothetical protein
MISFVFSSWIINEFHKYYLKHEQEYFIRYKTRGDSQVSYIR